MKRSLNQSSFKALIFSTLIFMLHLSPIQTFGFEKPTPEILAKKNRSATTAWNSIEIKYILDYDWVGGNRPSNFPKTYHSDKHFIQSKKAQLFFSDSMINDISPAIMSNFNYFDGKQFGNRFMIKEGEEIKTDEFRIKKHFGMEDLGRKERPEMLQYQFVGLKPIYDSLVRKNELRELDWLGRKCSIFQFDKVNGANDKFVHEYWIDQESGWVLRYFLFLNDKDRQGLRPNSEWAAASLDNVQGKIFPLNAEYNKYDENDTENALQVKMIIKCLPETIFFDQTYPDSTFWPTLDQETKVIDYIKGTFKTSSSKNFQNKLASKGSSIIAEEPVSYSSFIAKALGVLGLGALIIAGYKILPGK